VAVPATLPASRRTLGNNTYQYLDDHRVEIIGSG
jgi:hypothetical protein